MEKCVISDISRALIEIAWYFGPRGLNGKCCENLTMPEFKALDKIAATRNCAVQDIGYSLGFTKSGATRIVNRVERKGYVKKIRSSDDARVCCVRMTKTGEQVLLLAKERYMENLHNIVSKMKGHSLDEVAEVLTAMAEATNG